MPVPIIGMILCAIGFVAFFVAWQKTSSPQQVAKDDQKPIQSATISEPQRAPANQIQPIPTDAPIFWAPASISEIVQVENSNLNGDPMVTVLKMYGAKNTAPEPLLNVKAYVTPELTGKDIPMVFYDPHLDVSGKTSVLPGEVFNLYSDLRPTTKDQQGVSLSDYLQTYGGIAIRVESNGKTVFHRDFAYSEIKRMLAAKQDEYLAKKKLP